MGLKQKTHTSPAPRALISPKEPQASSKDAFKNGSGGNVMSNTGALQIKKVIRGRDYQRGCPEAHIKMSASEGL